MDAPIGASSVLATWRRSLAIAKSFLLWAGGVLLLLAAAGHQIEFPGSKASIWLIVASLLLLPPSRLLIGRLITLTVSVTTLLLLLIGGSGLVQVGMKITEKKDSEARTIGYSSDVDLQRAKSLGLTSAADLAEHDAKLKAAAEAAAAKVAAEAAEAKRQQDEKEQRERIAATAEQQKKDADCKKDLQCWGDKHSIKASFACRPYVERLAKYQFEWTDGWLDTKFSRFRWKNMAKGQVTYIGDKIKFQNGFGAWQFATYACDYDPVAEVVLNVDATPGRLPQ